MTNGELRKAHHRLLEQDIVACLAALTGLELRQALDIYYKSRLSRQIEEGRYGIDGMDAQWLARDLLENEPELFQTDDPSKGKEGQSVTRGP